MNTYELIRDFSLLTYYHIASPGDNLLNGWISCFESLLFTTTDQGTQFEAQLFSRTVKINTIQMK